jgi:vWA-MoxR associated protein C-terminal domain/Trypsin-like peptidase domain/vWA-MoxR associated protein middle region (VMAP-M) 1
MTFTKDDYQKAIARILREGSEVGTGFLVAPGYVLTCAHVVLQAIGSTKDFTTYQGKPQENIFLDFPVLDVDQKIEAEVFEWLPYNLYNGDVAVLKLLTPEPTGAKPMPLDEFECDDVKNDQHSIYGFGRNPVGGQSDAYRPKVPVAGGRFQLCKFGDPKDETIEPGFSGAPAWNDEKNCVIGMVATAKEASKEGYHVAYAIPTKVLRPVLKKIEAFYLYDVLIQSLKSCDDDDRGRLRVFINAALGCCNPNSGNRPWQEQLIELNTDRALALGWEDEGLLVKFAMMLVRMDGIRENTFYALKNWVKNVCRVEFSKLLERIVCEMTQHSVPRSNICQHLMVVVKKLETIDGLSVSMWPVVDRNTCIENPPASIVQDVEIGAITELSGFIHRQILDLSWSLESIIHLFLPRTLFSCDIEMECFNRFGDTLGSEYLFVIRTNKNFRQGYINDWHNKWRWVKDNHNRPSRDVFTHLDCATEPQYELLEKLQGTRAAVLMNWDSWNSIEEFLGSIEEEKGWALPVVLWSRELQFQNNLSDVLDGDVSMLKDRIKQKRVEARRSPEKILGHHLSLIWEDPKILPPCMLPDTQFDQEEI